MTDPSTGETTLPDAAKSAPLDRAEHGPLDESEANAVRPYVDLGGIKLVPREGLQLRLEIEEGTKRVVAVGIDFAGSTLQIQPFAAPRSSGLWHEIRAQIVEQVRSQGGETQDRDGSFGPEIVARIPVTGGEKGATRIARFVGVDGPRWFLRGVIAGQGAIEAKAATAIDDVFRSIVVVRGTTPMPPRDLIPLQVPQGAAQAGTAQSGTAQAGTAQLGTAQSGTAQSGAAHVSTPQAGTAASGPAATA